LVTIEVLPVKQQSLALHSSAGWVKKARYSLVSKTSVFRSGVADGTMASAAQIATTKPQQIAPGQPFYSISELAERWRCSRASVYNRIRGDKVIDFAATGRKGHKLVPLGVVLKIERAHLKVLR
jgi:hypothetical protein